MSLFGYTEVGENNLDSGNWPKVNATFGSTSSFSVVMDPLLLETNNSFGSTSTFSVTLVPVNLTTNNSFGSASFFEEPLVLVNSSFGSSSIFSVQVVPSLLNTNSGFGSTSSFNVTVNPMPLATNTSFGSSSTFSVTVAGATLSENEYVDTFVIPAIRAWIVDPTNTVIPVTELQYGKQTNAGHTWRAQCTGLLNQNYDVEGIWTAYLQTRKGLWTSPPLALVTQDEDQANTNTTVLAGVDYTSWRASTEGLSGPIFQYETVDKIADFIALCANTQIQYLGDIFNYSIEEYNFHSGSLLSHLSQITHDFGWNWKIGDSGEFVLYPVDYSFNAYRTYYPSTYKSQLHPSVLALYMRFLKQSRASTNFALVATTPGLQSSTLPTPLAPGSIHVVPQNIMGQVAYLAFQDSGGAICQFFRFNNLVPFTPPTSTNPAVKVSWSVLAPQAPFANFNTFVRVLVGGRSPGPAGAYDNVFELDFPNQIPLYEPLFEGAQNMAIVPNGGVQDITGLTGIYYPAPAGPDDYWLGAPPLIVNEAPPARFKVITVSSSLWPTIDSMIDGTINDDYEASIGTVMRRLWIQEQKGYETWSRELAEIDPFFEPGEEMLEDNYGPAARVETTHWSVGQSVSNTITGFIPVAVPSGNAVLIGQRV